MPVALSYPGVYIQEVPSGVHTITGVATSIAGFVGYFSRGPFDEPRLILSLSDFEREFGGLQADSWASYAIQQFFLNGGQQAWVVRTKSGTTAKAAQATLGNNWSVTATTQGTWGNGLRVIVDHQDAPTTDVFNLTVRLLAQGKVVDTETFRFLQVSPTEPRHALTVINAQSRLIRLSVSGSPVQRPNETDLVASPDGAPLTQGDNGELPGPDELNAAVSTFDSVELINLLCVPDTDRLGDSDASAVIGFVAAYASDRRAFYIVDPPNTVPKDKGGIKAWLQDVATPRSSNAAAYFPRAVVRDPFDPTTPRNVPVSGIVAGVYARTDTERGVWKASAGLGASLRGIQSLEYSLTDAENGTLNAVGLNCLRTFRNAGSVVWGARTTVGSDAIASEWKYVSVRRLALFLEESLYRGTQFAVFEPNDEPLWAQIRLSLGTFMHSLFLQGAFQGTAARDAYFVKCDRETTTQADINSGIVNIVVGFAPLKPAEFVIISFKQMTGGA